MPTPETIRKRLQAELARIAADQGLSPEEREAEKAAEIQAAQEVLNEISAQDPERKAELSGAGKVGAGFETAFDAATLGVPSLLGDVVQSATSPESFAETRQARRERKASLRASNPNTATALEIGGSVLPAFIPGAGQAGIAKSIFGRAAVAAPKGAARNVLAKGAGSALAENVAQGSIAGGVGELGDDSGDSAAMGAVKGAGGGILGTAIGRIAGTGIRTVSRLGKMRPLDEEAVKKVKQINRRADFNYGKAREEATTTPAISEYLNTDPVAAPIAKDIREVAQYTGQPKSDAEVLMDTYKHLSQQQRAAQRVIDRAEDYRPDVSEVTLEKLRTSKQKALQAANATTDVVRPGRAVEVGPPNVAESAPPQSLRDALSRFNDERAEGMWRRFDVRGKRPGETAMQAQAREGLDRRIVEGRAPQTSGAPAPRRVVTRESETFTVPAGIPSLSKAINENRTLQGELDALLRGADIGRSVGGAKAVSTGKMLKDSRAAFREFDIPEMTRKEQEMALLGILGGGREAVRLSGNPITAFNIVPSVVRVPLYAARNRQLVNELERRLGRGGVGKGTERQLGGTITRALAALGAR